MSTSKHTPGPWAVTPEEWPEMGGYEAPQVFSIADEDNPQIVCTVAVRINWEANSCLIAAAPDLLEALKEALPYVKDKSGIGMNGPNTAAFVEQRIHAAIAKSEGGAK